MENDSSAPSEQAETPTTDLQVGESITLTDDEFAQVVAAEREIQLIHKALGERREQFLIEESQAMVALSNARRAYEDKVKDAATRHGLVLESDRHYAYNPSERKITRMK